MSTAYFRLRLIKKRLRKRNCTDPLKNHSYRNDESTKCRICFKDGEICITKHAQVAELSDMISRLCDIDLSIDHKLPKYLCDGCYSFLQQAINFRNTAKLSELSVNQCVGTNSTALSVSETCTKAESPKVLRKINNSIESDPNKYKKKQKNVRVQCSICLRLVTSSLYKRHLLRHTSAIHLVCDVCGKLYRKDNLIRHLKLHNFELPFHCHICPYRGRFMESLVIHMRTHSGEKPFPCNNCELRFLTRSNLNRHLLTHKKDRPYKCAECGQGFKSKGDIEIHMRCDHAGIKDFGCRMCGTKYGTKKSLMRHELRVHKREKMAKGRVPLYLQAEYRK